MANKLWAAHSHLFYFFFYLSLSIVVIRVIIKAFYLDKLVTEKKKNSSNIIYITGII